MFENLFSLKGRVALVTGGSRGIGKMIASGFLAQGAAKVYITARKAGPCEATAKELTETFDGECIALPIDMSTVAGCQTLADEIIKREPKLDILVNNAGAAWGANFDEFPENGWDKVLNLNLKSPFFLTKALARPLRAAAKERVGKVINITSIDSLGLNPLENYSYVASKAGLMHLTRRLALRLARDNIAVSAIAPGAFASEMNRNARDQNRRPRPSISGMARRRANCACSAATPARMSTFRRARSARPAPRARSASSRRAARASSTAT